MNGAAGRGRPGRVTQILLCAVVALAAAHLLLMAVFSLRLVRVWAEAFFFGVVYPGAIAVLGLWLVKAVRRGVAATALRRALVALTVAVLVAAAGCSMLLGGVELLFYPRTRVYESPHDDRRIVVREIGEQYTAYPVRARIFYEEQDNGAVFTRLFEQGTARVSWQEDTATVYIEADRYSDLDTQREIIVQF